MNLNQLTNLSRRFHQSAVVWSWTFNALRLASGLILLPLLVRTLSVPDLGMYYVFMSLVALLPLVDFGFSTTIGRYISYAMAGAEELKPQGMVTIEEHRPPNYQLLWQLLGTTRGLYRSLSLLALVLVGVTGSFTVGYRVQETTAPTITWVAWGITLVSEIWGMYSCWWGVFLMGMNQVMLANRLLVLAHSVKLVIAAGLLLAGGGLLSLPTASLICGLLQRQLARRVCLARLPAQESLPPITKPAASLLPIIWPNSWRLGLQLVTGYLSSNLNTFICLSWFGLAANAEYGLSVQVFSIIAGVSAVWTNVKWPAVGQYRTRGDYGGLQHLLRPRVWLLLATITGGSLVTIFLLPDMLRWLGSDKRVLPVGWLALLALNTWLASNYTFWGTLISTENRMPYIWPAIATNFVSLGLALALVQFSSFGLGALVLAPLIAGSLCNYWYWPLVAPWSIRTTWWKFMFARAK